MQVLHDNVHFSLVLIRIQTIWVNMPRICYCVFYRTIIPVSTSTYYISEGENGCNWQVYNIKAMRVRVTAI